jgi:hypothetical protein
MFFQYISQAWIILLFNKTRNVVSFFSEKRKCEEIWCEFVKIDSFAVLECDWFLGTILTFGIGKPMNSVMVTQNIQCVTVQNLVVHSCRITKSRAWLLLWVYSVTRWIRSQDWTKYTYFWHKRLLRESTWMLKSLAIINFEGVGI